METKSGVLELASNKKATDLDGVFCISKKNFFKLMNFQIV